MTIETIIASVVTELNRQLVKWGIQHHNPFYWFTIINEEVGEVAKALNENKQEEYRKELIHVIACCMRALINSDTFFTSGGLIDKNTRDYDGE